MIGAYDSADGEPLGLNFGGPGGGDVAAGVRVDEERRDGGCEWRMAVVGEFQGDGCGDVELLGCCCLDPPVRV